MKRSRLAKAARIAGMGTMGIAFVVPIVSLAFFDCKLLPAAAGMAAVGFAFFAGGQLAR